MNLALINSLWDKSLDEKQFGPTDAFVQFALNRPVVTSPSDLGKKGGLTVR